MSDLFYSRKKTVKQCWEAVRQTLIKLLNGLLVIILLLVPLNFVVYNYLHITHLQPAFLVALVERFADLPVLEMFSRYTQNPLPRQVAQLLIIAFYLLLACWLMINAIIRYGFVKYFCFGLEFHRSKVKSFLLQLGFIIMGFSMVFLDLYDDSISEGIKSIVMNAIFYDSNVALFVVYFFGTPICAIGCVGNIPILIIYIANKKFRNAVNRSVKHVQ